MHKKPKIKAGSVGQQHFMVSANRYYRLRADVQRGLKSSRQSEITGESREKISSLTIWREANNLTPDELAQRAQVPVGEIESIEMGSFDAPMSTYISLSAVLRIDVASIIGPQKGYQS